MSWIKQGLARGKRHIATSLSSLCTQISNVSDQDSGSALRILIDGPLRRPGIHFLLRPICCCLLDEVECPRDGDSGWMRNSRLDYLFLIPGSYSKLFGEHLAKLITNPRALKASPGRHEAALPAAPHFNKKGSATESRCFLSIRSHAEVCERSCLESGFGGVHIHSSCIDYRAQGCASFFCFCVRSRNQGPGCSGGALGIQRGARRV